MGSQYMSESVVRCMISQLLNFQLISTVYIVSFSVLPDHCTDGTDPPVPAKVSVIYRWAKVSVLYLWLHIGLKFLYEMTA